MLILKWIWKWYGGLFEVIKTKKHQSKKSKKALTQKSLNQGAMGASIPDILAWPMFVCIVQYFMVNDSNKGHYYLVYYYYNSIMSIIMSIMEWIRLVNFTT